MKAVSVFAICFSLILADSFLLTSCKDENQVIVESPPLGEPFEVHADNYSLNHYFVDTSYRSLYEQFYQNIPPIVNPASQIVEAEVWVQRQGISFDSTDRNGVAWINLPPRSLTGYDSTFQTSSMIPGTVERARFYRLPPTSYRLEGEGYLGVVGFDLYPVPDIVFAIAYRRADGSQYGDLLRNGFVDSTGTPMVLKMVKPMNLFSAGPVYQVAWSMLLKNIYLLYGGHISRHEFQLDISRRNQSGSAETAIQGHLLLRILGLDRLAADGSYLPDGDGKFDFWPERTIVQNSGELILPSLRPFDTGIRQYFMQRGLPLPDSVFFFTALYDTIVVAALQDSRNRYSIKGRAIFD